MADTTYLSMSCIGATRHAGDPDMERTATRSSFMAFALVGWGLLNLVQATLTPLHSDEVYYWAYGWELAWGYWDHAPAVGLLTFLGGSLLPHTALGARLFTVILGTLAILLLWRLTDRKDARLFFIIVCGLLIFHIGGFFIAPDGAMGFANVVLLTAYAAFLRRPHSGEGILLGAAAALVLYSKYQGLMLIGMLALAQPVLWREPGSWLALLTMIVLFLPGLNWLIEHDYGSIPYYAAEREKLPWSWNWTAEFIGGQFAMFGPFTGLILLPVVFLHRPADPFLRSMRTCAIGILIFLLLMSFRMRIMGNWTAAALPCVVLVAYDAFTQKANWRRWAVRLALASGALILVVRIWLMAGWPLPPQQRIDFHDWDVWAAEVHKHAAGRPVVFTNSFHLPSRYAYEMKTRDVYVLNNYRYHATQFDIWPIEERMQGRKVLLVSPGPCAGCDTISGEFPGTYRACAIDGFRSFQRLRIVHDAARIRMRRGEERPFTITLVNPTGLPMRFDQCKEYHFRPSYHIRRGRDYVIDAVVQDAALDTLVLHDHRSLVITVRAPEEAGRHMLLFSLATDLPYPDFGRHGEWLELDVIE